MLSIGGGTQGVCSAAGRFLCALLCFLFTLCNQGAYSRPVEQDMSQGACSLASPKLCLNKCNLLRPH